ncbi:MAG: YXWGXW repeat-containing protein [Ideonella sp.]
MKTEVSPSARRAACCRGLAAASIVLSAALAGCVVAPERGRFVGEVVLAAPPPEQVEVVGVAPTVGYVWTRGYWNWIGGRHVWVAGRWVAPRSGYYWEPHVWVRTGAGWHLREGHWARR